MFKPHLKFCFTFHFPYRKLDMGSSASALVHSGSKPTCIFDFSVDAIDNTVVALEQYRGKKAYLVINVARLWGLMETNYSEMQELHNKYRFVVWCILDLYTFHAIEYWCLYSEEGFEILAFPCNNIYWQEPGSNADVLAFVKGRGVTFPVFGKLECENGRFTHPLYKFLKQKKGGGITGRRLKWNYTKFLCDADGIPIKRGFPTSSPKSFEEDIIALLKK